MGSAKLETDPKRIEELARRMEDANWDFRCFLKRSDLSIGEIDSLVHEHYREITSQIDCRQYANCCRVARPLLQNRDINRLSAHLGISGEKFIREYLEKDEEGQGYFFKPGPCPFLKENLCAVYPHRPDDCRSFPHLQRKDFVFRLVQAISNCSICPIVFNVFEQLKRDLWRANSK
jgi:uncharacterized protein